MRRIALLACAAAGWMAAPVIAQAACPAIQVTGTATGTQRVPRMGPGSDLLTQSASFHNASGQEVRFTVTLVHRAFQSNFVAGQSYVLAPNARTTLMLGNVLRPGLAVEAVRAGVTLTCS